MKKNILVTGGSGFIGSHIADILTLNNYNVRLFDKNPSPYIKDNQEMFMGDILDDKCFDKALEGIDYVYHLAGIADISECIEKPVDTVKYNILGTTLLLDACVRHNITRFMFASTAYVYSDAGYFYRSSKQACENLIENYADLYNLKYTIIRYGSLYGPRAGNTNSIHNLVKQAVETGKITYYGTGEELREFIHVLDAAEISLKCLNEEFINSHVIISGHEKMYYRELLEMVKEIFSGKIDIEMRESIRKAHYKITPYNFNPKLGKKITNNSLVDLGQGLIQLIEEAHKEIHLLKNND